MFSEVFKYFISILVLILFSLTMLVYPFQIWSARDFKPVKTLSGHEAKVTSLDVIGGEPVALCGNLTLVVYQSFFKLKSKKSW